MNQSNKQTAVGAPSREVVMAKVLSYATTRRNGRKAVSQKSLHSAAQDVRLRLAEFKDMMPPDIEIFSDPDLDMKNNFDNIIGTVSKINQLEDWRNDTMGTVMAIARQFNIDVGNLGDTTTYAQVCGAIDEVLPKVKFKVENAGREELKKFTPQRDLLNQIKSLIGSETMMGKFHQYERNSKAYAYLDENRGKSEISVIMGLTDGNDSLLTELENYCINHEYPVDFSAKVTQGPKCKYCGGPLPSEAVMSCPHCGNVLMKQCPECKKLVPVESNKCKCGFRFDRDEEKTRAPSREKKKKNDWTKTKPYGRKARTGNSKIFGILGIVYLILFFAFWGLSFYWAYPSGEMLYNILFIIVPPLVCLLIPFFLGKIGSLIAMIVAIAGIILYLVADVPGYSYDLLAIFAGITFGLCLLMYPVPDKNKGVF